MRKQILIVLLASTVFSGCAAQSYSVAGSGVYLGSSSYVSSNLSIGIGYSSGPGWYGYPWYSSAYLQPVYPGYWPGYVSIGYGPGGFYGGFNWNWGYYYPSNYYRYTGYSGYNPYYSYGYRGHHRHGPYRHPAYRPYYAYSPYRHGYQGNHGGGHEYDRRNIRGNDYRPRQSAKQPVRIVRLPEHRPETGYSVNRSTNSASSVNSRSGNVRWKGDQPPPQRMHQGAADRAGNKQSRHEYTPVNSRQPVQVTRRAADVVEIGVGHTPPHLFTTQRPEDGRHNRNTTQPATRQIQPVVNHRAPPDPRSLQRGRRDNSSPGSNSRSLAETTTPYLQPGSRHGNSRQVPGQNDQAPPRQQVQNQPAPKKEARQQPKKDSGKHRSKQGKHEDRRR